MFFCSVKPPFPSLLRFRNPIPPSVDACTEEDGGNGIQNGATEANEDERRSECFSAPLSLRFLRCSVFENRSLRPSTPVRRRTEETAFRTEETAFRTEQRRQTKTNGDQNVFLLR